MNTQKEFTKRFNTCSAKWNLVFAYKSAAEIETWEEIESTGKKIEMITSVKIKLGKNAAQYETCGDQLW